MRDRVVSGVVIAFLAVGCILPACGVMPGTKPQIEPPQLEERLAELENEVAGLRDIVLILKESQDEIVLSHDEFGVILDGIQEDLVALTSEHERFVTGLGDAFSTFAVGGGYSPVPSGVGGGYSPVITEALDGITEALNVIAERNNYFYGKLMTVRDFEAEQAYLSERVGNIETQLTTMADIESRLQVIEARLGIVPPPPS